MSTAEKDEFRFLLAKPILKEVLVSGKTIFAANPTTRVMARGSEGTIVYPTHPNAKCFCSVGALVLATSRAMEAPGFPFLLERNYIMEKARGVLFNYITNTTHFRGIAAASDSLPVEEMLKLWDGAIATLDDPVVTN